MLNVTAPHAFFHRLPPSRSWSMSRWSWTSRTCLATTAQTSRPSSSPPPPAPPPWQPPQPPAGSRPPRLSSATYWMQKGQQKSTTSLWWMLIRMLQSPLTTAHCRQCLQLIFLPSTCWLVPPHNSLYHSDMACANTQLYLASGMASATKQLSLLQ